MKTPLLVALVVLLAGTAQAGSLTLRNTAVGSVHTTIYTQCEPHPENPDEEYCWNSPSQRQITGPYLTVAPFQPRSEVFNFSTPEELWQKLWTVNRTSRLSMNFEVESYTIPDEATFAAGSFGHLYQVVLTSYFFPGKVPYSGTPDSPLLHTWESFQVEYQKHVPAPVEPTEDEDVTEPQLTAIFSNMSASSAKVEAASHLVAASVQQGVYTGIGVLVAAIVAVTWKR